MKKKEQEEVIPAIESQNKEPVKEYDPECDQPTTLEQIEIYNKYARKNKRPVKVPDASFYPKVKVRFQRFDQPENLLKCRVRNKQIDWTGALKPGCVYELPFPVVKWLNSLAVPIFAEVKVDDQEGVRSETRQVGERARFSCQPLEYLNM